MSAVNMFDDLLLDTRFVTMPIKIAASQGVLKRGTLLAMPAAGDSTGVVTTITSGTAKNAASADATANHFDLGVYDGSTYPTPYAVLADDVDTGTGSAVSAIGIVWGSVRKSKVDAATGSTIPLGAVAYLRNVGIYCS